MRPRGRRDRGRRASAIATYLTIVHYAGGEPVCAVAHGCATVQKSDYAQLAGVPVALLGVLGYSRSSPASSATPKPPAPRPRSCRSAGSPSPAG